RAAALRPTSVLADSLDRLRAAALRPTSVLADSLDRLRAEVPKVVPSTRARVPACAYARTVGCVGILSRGAREGVRARRLAAASRSMSHKSPAVGQHF